jgi:hypothetical protein
MIEASEAGAMDGVGSVGELLLGLPGALGLLTTLAVGMGSVHLLINWVAKPGRSVRDRGRALLLVLGSLLVPMAALGYVRADWHRHVPVRIAEGAFGALLLGFLVWFLVASLRHPASSSVPEPPSDISAPEGGTSTAGPPAPATRQRSELLPGVTLAALVAASGVAYVAHALDLFHHAWA